MQSASTALGCWNCRTTVASVCTSSHGFRRALTIELLPESHPLLEWIRSHCLTSRCTNYVARVWCLATAHIRLRQSAKRPSDSATHCYGYIARKKTCFQCGFVYNVWTLASVHRGLLPLKQVIASAISSRM